MSKDASPAHDWVPIGDGYIQRCTRCSIRRTEPEGASSRAWGIFAFTDNGWGDGGVFRTVEELEQEHPCTGENDENKHD